MHAGGAEPGRVAANAAPRRHDGIVGQGRQAVGPGSARGPRGGVSPQTASIANEAVLGVTSAYELPPVRAAWREFASGSAGTGGGQSVRSGRFSVACRWFAIPLADGWRKSTLRLYGLASRAKPITACLETAPINRLSFENSGLSPSKK